MSGPQSPLPRTSKRDALLVARNSIAMLRKMVAQRPGGPHTMTTDLVVKLATTIELLLKLVEKEAPDA